ncbi:hypothetical protein HOLleu_08066 [Holothuria leucospilota]|uniref:Uncharacterized protein n=1 Tax=Holothuria leucospilota TaxID=206669 RepID=A0A9Q1CI27_HOLLE|nr:hypothetical protein HOLleu_08066 [Holothuria leucospilota]
MEHSVCEEDIGVITDNRLSFNKHITEKVNKANSVMGLKRRSFTYLDHSTFMLLYSVSTCRVWKNQVWNPCSVKHTTLIENVQRRATELVPGLKYLPCDQRLAVLDLPTLSYRRLRPGGMAEVYKIVSGKRCNCLQLILFCEDCSTREHPHKIYKRRSRLHLRN